MSELTREYFESIGYEVVSQLDDNSWVGIGELLFSTALYMGMDQSGWAKRYCFELRSDAIQELIKLTKQTDTPNGWIAKRPK